MRSLLYKALLASALAAFFALPVGAFANTLTLSPQSGTYEPGQTFPVRVLVSTPQSINAVSGEVSFPADKLQVVSVSKTSSILTLWVQEPSYSNAGGTVDFEGVVPNPGYIGNGGMIVTINFRAVGQGSANIKFNSGSILANDGSGTNILKTLNTASYTIEAQTAPVATPITANDTAPATSSGTNGPVVTSSTHPNSKLWYATDNAKFSWSVPPGTTATRLLLGKSANSVPTVVYDPPISSKELTDIEDGIWYMHVQFKNASGWGPVTHFMFKTDNTPPETFTVKPIINDDPTDPRPRFSFEATDIMSGVDHYTVQIDTGKAEVWRDQGNGIYQAPVLGPGEHTLLAKAVDGAGNTSVASSDFKIEGIETPVITSYTGVVSDGAFSVSGTAPKGMTVRIELSKDGSEAVTQNTTSSDNGEFALDIDPSKLSKGTYKLTAVSIDDRGAESEPSPSKTVLVNTGWLESLSSSLIKLLAVAMPVLALLFALVLLVLYAMNKIRRLRRGLRTELHSIENLVDKTFLLLKEDMEDSIRMLEKAKTRRKLTDEEDAIIERLRQNLRDASKVIHKEVRDAERKIGD